MIFLWAHSSVGSLFGGIICVWDVLSLGWYSFGLNERWIFRISVRYLFLYIIRDVSAILIIGSSMQVALTCGLFFYEVVTTTVCFPVR